MKMQPVGISDRFENKGTAMKIKDTFKYKSTDIAIYIISLANENRIFVNMTKIQKLLYIVYGAYLSLYEERLINEHPQAWPYGPVFPTTRNKLLKQDFSNISLKQIAYDEQKRIENEKELKNLILFILSKFGSWNAGQLSEWSHQKGSPWYQTTNQNDFEWGDVIPDELICSYFKQIIIKKKA